MIAHINHTWQVRFRAVNLTALQIDQSWKMLFLQILSKANQPNQTFKIQFLYSNMTKTNLSKSEDHPKRQSEGILLVKLTMILILSWCSSKMGCLTMFQNHISRHLNQIKIGKIIKIESLCKSKNQKSLTAMHQRLNQFKQSRMTIKLQGKSSYQLILLIFQE